MIGPVQTATGGVVSNTGLALHHLGESVRLVAKLGQDEFGELIRNKFMAVSPRLSEHFIFDSLTHTSYTLVLSPPNQDRHFLHHPGANDTLLASDIPESAFADINLMHFGYPPLLAAMAANGGAELSTLFGRAKAAGLITSLDMAGVDPDSVAGRVDWLALLEKTLPNVDIFMPSLDEVSFMLGETIAQEVPQLKDLRRISQQLLDYGAGIVVLKLGEYGLYLRSSSDFEKLASLEQLNQNPKNWLNIEQTQPCFEVNPIGTTGAGDSTIAGFLAAFSRGLDPKTCLLMASGVGACNVEAIDALSGLRSWDETYDRIEKGWKLSPKQINGELS